MSLVKKILISLSRIIVGVPIILLIIVGLLYLYPRATWTGRSVGLSAAILGGVLFCSIKCWKHGWFQRIRFRFYAVAIPIGLLLYVVPMLLAPSGENTGSHIQSRFLNGQGTLSRYSPCNVMPESDQIKVAMTLCPLGQRNMSFAETARMRSLVLPHVRRNGPRRRLSQSRLRARHRLAATCSA